MVPISGIEFRAASPNVRVDDPSRFLSLLIANVPDFTVHGDRVSQLPRASAGFSKRLNPRY